MAGEGETLRVAVITLGGERKERMKEHFEKLSQTSTTVKWEVVFLDGVKGSDLKSRPSLREAAALLLEGDDGLKLNDVHNCVRFLKKHGLGELGCLLAHLQAMEYVTSNSIDFILEDSARIAPCTFSTLVSCAKALRNGSAGMVYCGFLGSEANLEKVYTETMKPAKENGDHLVDVPVGKDETSGKAYDMIWSSFAFGITRDGYQSFRDALRKDMGSFLFGRKGKPAEVKPVDKILPRILLRGGHRVLIPTTVCAYRAPMLTSHIHSKYDARFAATSTHLLELQGLQWADVCLPSSERIVAESRLWETTEDNASNVVDDASNVADA